MGIVRAGVGDVGRGDGMTREEVYKGLEQADAYFRSSFDAMYGTFACEKFRSWTDAIEHALALLKAQETQDDDADFMTHIICEICDYAVKNEMEPNDTLNTIADNIKALLKISTFNNWKEKHNG